MTSQHTSLSMKSTFTVIFISLHIVKHHKESLGNWNTFLSSLLFMMYHEVSQSVLNVTKDRRLSAIARVQWDHECFKTVSQSPMERSSRIWPNGCNPQNPQFFVRFLQISYFLSRLTPASIGPVGSTESHNNRSSTPMIFSIMRKDEDRIK